MMDKRTINNPSEKIDFPYMIMCTFEEVKNPPKIAKATAHITLKRRFKLINTTETQLINQLSSIDWKPIKIKTKGIQRFRKSGIEHITTTHNSEIKILLKELRTTIQPFTETRDPHKEIGYDAEHANAHISLNKLDIDTSEAIETFGNTTLQINYFLLVKDTTGDSLEILAKF